MFALRTFAALVLASSALAKPLARQQPAPGCANFGSFGSSGDEANFYLNAVFADDHEYKLLVLGGNGDPAATVSYLGMADSIAEPLGGNFTMQDSGMHALAEGAVSMKYGAAVDAGGFVPFVALQDGASDDPAPIWCLLYNTSPEQGSAQPTLAVNGDSDNFSVCTSTEGQDNVVYKHVENSTEYDVESCRVVQILGVLPGA